MPPDGWFPYHPGICPDPVLWPFDWVWHGVVFGWVPHSCRPGRRGGAGLVFAPLAVVKCHWPLSLSDTVILGHIRGQVAEGLVRL